MAEFIYIERGDLRRTRPMSVDLGQNFDVTPEAKGLMYILRTSPPRMYMDMPSFEKKIGWSTYKRKKYMRELKEKGYIVLTRQRRKNGSFCWIVSFYDEVITGGLPSSVRLRDAI